MSKSYKKYTCFTDNQNGGAKKEKKFASKKVRRVFDLDNGCSYKRLYCSWNIHDFKFPFYNKFDVERFGMYNDKEKSILFPQWYKNFRGHI